MSEAFCMQKLKIALIQLAVSQSKETNLERLDTFIKEAAQNGASLVCLSEYCNAPYDVKYAESIPDGITSQFLSQTAKKNSIYLVGGSFMEKCDGKYYNTCLTYGPDGELLAKFRKMHLFDIDIPGKRFIESEIISAGNCLSMFKIDKLSVGLGICYDIRFPLLSNIYAEKGCNLLIYPAAFSTTTGPLHWELLQRARAVDNQVYVAAIGRARDTTLSYITYGHTSLVNPWGQVVSTIDEKEGIVYGEIDLSSVEKAREEIKLGMHKRSDLYHIECTNFDDSNTHGLK